MSEIPDDIMEAATAFVESEFGRGGPFTGTIKRTAELLFDERKRRTGLTGEGLGVVLLGLLREIGNGTRNYPAHYANARVLVGLGLAEYAYPEVGDGYWLRLTDVGRFCAVSVREEK